MSMTRESRTPEGPRGKKRPADVSALPRIGEDLSAVAEIDRREAMKAVMLAVG